MKWIESRGGPLVVVPQAWLQEWRGVFGPESDSRSHYDRACDVVDQIATIRVGGSDVLVLGDEPFRTTWIPMQTGGIFVRWTYADHEGSIATFLHSFNPATVTGDTGVSLHVSGGCVMFDAAEPGDENTGDAILIALSPGTYIVKSATADPSTEVRVLIHELILDNDDTGLSSCDLAT